MKFERRPWGWFLTLYSSPTMWIKLIRVGWTQRTSVQSHRERDEIHISLRGIVRVPRDEKHCLYNGTYLEIATGAPREEDIDRFDDKYGRV